MATSTVRYAVSDPADHVHHSIGTSIALHLVPGVLMLVFYLLAAPTIISWGYPPLFASLLTIPLILVPVMLGYLAYEARRKTGRYSPLAVVGYRNALSRKRSSLYITLLIAWGAVAFASVDVLLGATLLQGAFGWLPAWFLNPADLDQIAAMATTQQVIFLLSLLVFAGFIAPIVEEMYFRGHLLPGIAYLGIWAPVLNVALFTLYHFESPWEAPARFLMVLPMVYVVWRTRSLQIAIIVHVALNVLSALAVLVAVVAAG